ncbi:hypothetical protein ACJ41O_003158 [Fusarium nematophilum]
MSGRLIEATYLMTRDMAMEQAAGLQHKLGHRDWDQAALEPEMTRWLSVPVIKVLSEDMKNKVFMWCSRHKPSWEDEIRAAKDDLAEYRFTTTATAQNADSLNHAADTLKGEIKDMLAGAKDEILRNQRETTADILEQLASLETTTVTQGRRTKKRRTEGDDPIVRDLVEKLRNIDEGLCLLMNEDSELVSDFREVAQTISPGFTANDASPRRKTHYAARRLMRMRNEQGRGIGLRANEFKALAAIMRCTGKDSPAFESLELFVEKATSKEQYEELMEVTGESPLW